ncbi:MAG: hypothetical protein AB8B88_08600 [Devosiaceae bacterium]
MTNHKSFKKAAIAGILALGTIAGGATAANATGFFFSWSTPQGTYTFGPQGQHFQPHHVAPRQLHRPQVQERHQIRRRDARRTLRQAGFRDIQFLRERNRVYVFEARGQRGYRRIAVNKFNGNIIWRWGRG